MDFNGKNILVVGGSSGIGLSLINSLAAKGAKVFNVSRTASKVWPDGITHLPLDVLGDVSSLPANLPDQLHGLVYSVGSINLKPFSRISEDDFLTDYKLNVIGAARIIQQAYKSLRNAQGSSIVLISSVAARSGMSYHASISAAKSGVEGLALSLATEFASQNIRVNVVATSLTHDNLSKSDLISRNIQEKTSGTEVIRRLLFAGLVKQWDDENDKRAKRISITKQGKELLYQVFTDMNDVGKMVSGKLSLSEKLSPQYLLQKLETFHYQLHENKSINSKDDLKSMAKELSEQDAYSNLP